MRLRTTMYLLAIAAAVMALWGATSSLRSLQDSSAPLVEAAGTIAEVRISTARLSKSEVSFRLEGDSDFFQYPLFFPRYYYLSEQLAPGKTIALRYRDGSRDDLWSLKLDRQTILDLESAAAAHRRAGYVGFVFAVGMAGVAYYFFRLAGSTSREA
jgi:hypothetical protein